VPPALVLALDTATPAVVAALVALAPDPAGLPTSADPAVGDQGAPPRASATARSADRGAGRGAAVVLAARVTADARRHGELLAPSVAAVLAEAGCRPGDLTAVVAGLGPGPFTGLRVGLVTAAAFADALGIPAYGACSLDAVAAQADLPAGRLLVATDARRREVYWAAYDGAGTRIAGPDVDRPADLAARLAGLDLAAMCGAGARLYREALPLPLVGRADHPDPAALAGLARDRVLAGAPTEPLTPLYLRRPDASAPGRPKPVTAGAS
jgi:tRNA threonylcarbamoyl adenosine modification protein YeaZ